MIFPLTPPCLIASRLSQPALNDRRNAKDAGAGRILVPGKTDQCPAIPDTRKSA